MLASVAGAVLLIPVLRSTDWNPTILLAFGEEATSNLEYAESLLGEVDARVGQGHDGKFFFVQAVDPWATDPAALERGLDLPLYRAQRMLYPALAGGLGLATPSVVAWLLVGVNIVALGLGTYAAAQVSRGMGGSAIWGLAFPLNLGVFSELLVAGAGIVALAAALAGVRLLQTDRSVLAGLAFAGSALSREVMLVSAVGVAVWLFIRRRRREALVLVALPTIAVGLWALYLRSRLGWVAGGDQVRAFGLPGEGFVRASERWLTDPIDLLTGAVVVFVLIGLVVRTVRGGTLVAWFAVGFAPLALLFTDLVWFDFFDISRAVAPAITAFVLVTFSGRSVRENGVADDA